MKRIIAAILLCALLGIMLVSCAPKVIYKDKPSGGGVGLVVDPNANDQALQTDPVEVPGIAIPGWGTLKIPAGQKDNIIANFNNPDENAGKYYLQFELSLLNSDGSKGEVLYKSGLVEPGKYIQTISLSRALEAGEYEANMFVQPYKMSDQSPTNNLNSKMKLIVVNAGTAG